MANEIQRIGEFYIFKTCDSHAVAKDGCIVPTEFGSLREAQAYLYGRTGTHMPASWFEQGEPLIRQAVRRAHDAGLRAWGDATCEAHHRAV